MVNILFVSYYMIFFEYCLPMCTVHFNHLQNTLVDCRNSMISWTYSSLLDRDNSLFYFYPYFIYSVHLMHYLTYYVYYMICCMDLPNAHMEWQYVWFLCTDLERVHGFTFGDSLDEYKRSKWQDFKTRLNKVSCPPLHSHLPSPLVSHKERWFCFFSLLFFFFFLVGKGILWERLIVIC